jgi:hypothetical protein
MRTIMKLVLIVAFALQSGGHPRKVESDGWAWCDDSQETVALETRTYRMGWPYVIWKITESWGCEEAPIRVLAFRPLGLSFTAGFWLVILGLIDTLWPERGGSK